jgi:hypothetical protein
MKVPEVEQFQELKEHLRYLNEKILEAFSRFFTLAIALVGGVYYVHINLAVDDLRRTGLGMPSSAALSLLGAGTIVLIVVNWRSWMRYRKTLSDCFPEIGPSKGIDSWLTELCMCLIIVAACAGFWVVNPLR